jgi:hypothetical protein
MRTYRLDAGAATSTSANRLKVHFLTAVRADADRAEIQDGAAAIEVTLPVLEMPE